MPARVVVCLSLLAALTSACQAERWQIGSTLGEADAGLGLDAAAAPLCPETASEGIPLESSAPALGPGHAGSWVARLSGEEATKFPSQLLELRLETSAAHLHFETGSALPPLLDGRGGYLCRAPGTSTCASASGFVPAFDYTLWSVAARGSILSFQLYLEQPWHEWCEQQRPVAQEPVPGCEPSYDVEASYGSVSWGDPCAVLRGTDWYDIDCDRLATVERHPCVCNADGCRAAARLLELHLRLVAPDVLEGALWFAAGHAQVVRFERARD